MAGITGTVREMRDNKKYVGLFEGEVIAINPNMDELKEILGEGANLKGEPDYFTDKDGVRGLRVSIWVKDIHTGKPFNKIIWLEDRPKDPAQSGTFQYINSKGTTLYCTSIDDLPAYMRDEKTHRAKVGESDLAEFVKSWLNLDIYKEDFELDLQWEKLMQGKVTGLTKFINTNVPRTTTELAYVKMDQTERGTFAKQMLFSKKFIPGYLLKNIQAVDYNNPEEIQKVIQKDREYSAGNKESKLSVTEKYVLQVAHPEYGLKHFFGGFSSLREYNPAENVVTQDSAMLPNDDSGYRY